MEDKKEERLKAKYAILVENYNNYNQVMEKIFQNSQEFRHDENTLNYIIYLQRRMNEALKIIFQRRDLNACNTAMEKLKLLDQNPNDQGPFSN